MRDDDIVKLLRPAYDITREAWRRRGEEAAKEIEQLRSSVATWKDCALRMEAKAARPVAQEAQTDDVAAHLYQHENGYPWELASDAAKWTYRERAKPVLEKFEVRQRTAPYTTGGKP